MIFELTAEQRSLRQVTHDFLAEVSPEEKVRRLMESELGHDEKVWQRMADELGLLGLLVPEELGGSGAGPVELAIVLDQAGRSLLCAPLLSASLACVAVLASGDAAAAAELLPRMADGSLRGVVALPRGPKSTVAAEFSADGWLLTGELPQVLDAAGADLLVVVAESPSGPALFRVDSAAPGVDVTPLPTFDRTRRLARVALGGVRARLLGELEGARAAVARLRDVASVALSAECAGGAAKVLEQSVAYAKDRVQFGRAIGSFQAVKHLCADTLVDVESALSAAYYAAWAAEAGDEELRVVAPLAHAFATDTFLEAAHANIQIHGGIAFTWEHPAHLFYRRAKSSVQLFGDSNSHRERLVTELGL